MDAACIQVLQEAVGLVVLPEDKDKVLTLRQIRDFGMQKLSKPKLPELIVHMPDLPKGPTGKPLRVSLCTSELLVHGDWFGGR